MEEKKVITKRQKELLLTIYNSLKNEGYPPSFEELKLKLNVKSNQAVIDHLNGLEKKELIARGSKSARSIKIRALGYKELGVDPVVPVLGTSYCGAFATAFELAGSWKIQSGEIKRLDQEVFIVEVSGDSMINAGIFDGDRLLIQTASEFSNGDIVLAQRDDGTTIKRLVRQNRPPFLFLKPENPKYKHLSFTQDTILQGKVIGKLEQGLTKPLVQGKFL